MSETTLDAARQPTPWTIAEFNSEVKRCLEESFLPLWIAGEIGGIKLYPSGHVYLTLKDSTAKLDAVIWRGEAEARRLRLVVGVQVEVFGRPSLYDRDGRFQFVIQNVRHAGVGDLSKRFEELKAKLSSEGLFDERRKRPLPLLPKAVGLVTSPEGAAIRDFLKVMTNRFPTMKAYIFPCAVQGKGVENDLAAGVDFFNRTGGVDAIVLTRGGGSMEDLWAFNEEVLARAVARSRIPVVSAIGHEVDFTICDFVSDRRAATPSNAAEILFPDLNGLLDTLQHLRRRMSGQLELRLSNLRRRLQRAQSNRFFIDPFRMVQDRRQQLDSILDRLAAAPGLRIERERRRLATLTAKIETLSPTSTLMRGYSILTDSTGSAVTTCRRAPGERLTVILADGRLAVSVEASP